MARQYCRPADPRLLQLSRFEVSVLPGSVNGRLASVCHVVPCSCSAAGILPGTVQGPTAQLPALTPFLVCCYPAAPVGSPLYPLHDPSGRGASSSLAQFYQKPLHSGLSVSSGPPHACALYDMRHCMR